MGMTSRIALRLRWARLHPLQTSVVYGESHILLPVRAKLGIYMPSEQLQTPCLPRSVFWTCQDAFPPPLVLSCRRTRRSFWKFLFSMALPTKVRTASVSSSAIWDVWSSRQMLECKFPRHGLTFRQ